MLNGTVCYILVLAMEIKNKGLWSVITFLLAVFTVFLVVRSSGMTMEQLQDALSGAAFAWLFPGGLCALGMLVFEGEAVLAILKRAGYPQKQRSGFLYACGDAYFSAITPSATGGQPASAFFMMRDGAPFAVATASLLANLVMYNAAILAVGAFCLLTRPQLYFHFQPGCRLLIVLGITVLAGMGIVFFLLLWRQKTLSKIAQKVLGILQKLHLVRHPQRWEEKLHHTMNEYGACVALLAGSKKMWILAFTFNVLQRIAQFSVTVFAFLSLGGDKDRLFDLWVTQCFVSLGSNCVPIPGSMGVTDYLMLDGYRNLMAKKMAYPLQVLSRGMSFYGTVIISGIVVLAAYLAGRKKGKARAMKRQ